MAVTSNRDVVVTGTSCQLAPDVDTPQRLFDFCAAARCSSQPIPASRWNTDHYYHPRSVEPGYYDVKAGGYLDHDVAAFDAPFFNISEADARAIDPQMRLLLENAYVALEEAGITLQDIANSHKVGVFSGASKSDYATYLETDYATAPKSTALGTATTMFANRLSYFFNVHGPSISVDTACSSSLTALDMACDSIRSGRCEVAIVGGCLLQLTPLTLSGMAALGTLSPEGKSLTFDENADGYGRGEGAACVILTSREYAMRSNCPIRATVRASGVNHCGRSQGIASPDGPSQVRMIQDVYASVGLDPIDTAFVEAHGTGTQRGDEIEVQSIAEAFKVNERGPGETLLIGSCKSNFGHTEAASGIVSIIKCVGMLEKRMILPNVNFEKPNSVLASYASSMIVPLKCLPWPENAPLRISINNFGFGGSNAHVILEREADKDVSTPRQLGHAQEEESTRSSTAQIFHFTARDEHALKSQLGAYSSYLDGKTWPDAAVKSQWLNDLSYTLSCRRSRLDWRATVVAGSTSELHSKISTGDITMSRRAPKTGVVLAFTGQGSAYPEMAVSLLSVDLFAQAMKQADVVFKKLGAEWSILDELAAPKYTSRINSAELAQPAVTAIQLAIVILLREWNVVPNALIGHSSGEIAAAFAARALDFDTALAIAFYRGKIASSSVLPERLGKGAMMAIGASPEEVEPLLAGLSSGIAMIACYNSADSVTVAGDECAIDQLVALTKDLGLFSRKLLIDQAYHSDHMLPLAAPYFDLIKNVLPKCRATAEDGSAQTGVLYSSVTGAALPLDKLKSGWYWASNLTSPVLFATAFEAMLKDFKKSHDGNIHIVEIGSHKALAGPIKALCDTNTSIRASYSSTLVRKSDDKRCLLETAAECSRAGVSVDMDAVFQTMRDQRRESQPQCLVGLPKYSFNHTRRYWHASRLAHGPDMKNGRPWNALLGRRVDTTPTPSIQCRNIFKLSWIPWLRDHVVNGTIVFPLAGFLCIAVEALEVFREERSIVVHGFQLSKVSVSKAFALTDDEQYELWTTLTTNSTDSTELDGAAALNFEISSWTAARGYIQHCSGTASLVLQDESGLVVDPLEEHSEAVSNPMRTKLANLRQSAQRGMDRDSYYRQLARGGLAYGHYFKGIQEIKVGNNVGFGRVHGFDTASSMPGGFEGTLRVHPATLDAALQVSGIHVGSGSFEGQTYMPVYMERMFVLSSAQHIADISLDVFTFDSITPEKSKTTSVNLLMCLSGSDTPIIEVDQLTCLDVDQAEDRLGQADMINPHKTMWLDHPDFLSLQEIAEISTVNDPQDMAKLEAASTAAEQALLSLLDFVRSLTYLNPSMSILEIGAGISGLASRIQEVVTSSSGPRYQHYDYTDISSETFPKTEDQFPNITCRRLDLTRDVGSQGFEMGSFDLVLGSLASYPACDAPECLRNLSLLLKPNGHLALFGLGTSYPLAQLPDICTQLSQSFGPSEIQWSTMLRTAEFHAISTLRQGANSCAVWARKGSQKLMQNGETAPTPVGLVASPLAWDKAHAIKSMLESSNGKTCWTPTMLTPNAAKTFTGTLICFEDVSVLNLASADHENFNTIQQLLCTAKNIIWVTSPDYTAEESCRQAFALGFGRVLRAEDATRRFVVLQADAQDTSTEALSRCLEAMMLYEGAGSTGASDLENEYRQRGNRLQFARLLPDELLYDGIARLADVTKSSTVALSDSSVTISATCDRPGTMNSLHYAASPEPIALEGLGDYEVVLQVEAVGVNFKDLLITLGRVPWEEPGKECSGVVLAAGKHASFVAGDRVVHWGDGLLANRIICHDYSLAAIPSFMTMQEAASIPLVFSTAYECLVNVARLEDGERVLIHAASGGVGQAAIMLSQWLKAEVYCTVSTPEKKALIMSRYGIPASRIFSSRSPAFAKKLMEETGGKGVDVVLNSVAGDMLKATWSCMGVQGRFVEIGKRDALTNNTLDMLPFAKGCSYNAVDLGLTIGNKPKAARRLLSKVMSLFEERQHFRPVEPITVYPAGEIHDALRKMQAGKHTGKLVVNMNKGQTVDVRNSRSAFHGDASYIITGGTGGLGCSLVRWMISRGARNIHLFSRSGAKALDTANWDETLAFARQENAVVTAHVCDIVNINDVERTLGAMTAAGTPTVKGVIHAAMVLRDALYERTNATDWETVIAPKIHGAINLHRALNDHPQLDFFVCLSSIAILGIVPGQAAYAGGNCVLDAFCSWRQSQGLAASSISLPAISDAGYVAEQAPLPGHEKLEASQLSSREVKMLVEAALDRSLFNPASNNSHTVAGLVKHPGTTQVLQDKGPLFSVLLRDNANAFGDDVVRPSDGSTVSIKASLSETTSPEEAEKVVAAALVGKLASMMSVSPDDVTMETSIGNLGIDSLVAVELRNWLAKELEATIPVLTIVSTASVSVLVELVMSKSSLVVGKFGLANGDVPK